MSNSTTQEWVINKVKPFCDLPIRQSVDTYSSLEEAQKCLISAAAGAYANPTVKRVQKLDENTVLVVPNFGETHHLKVQLSSVPCQFGYRFEARNRNTQIIEGSGFFRTSRRMTEEEQKEFVNQYTSGHYLRSNTPVNTTIFESAE